jgi:hypothetical protein
MRSNLQSTFSVPDFATEITMDHHGFFSLVPEGFELVCQFKIVLEKM